MYPIQKRIEAAYFYGKCNSLRKTSLKFNISKSSLQRWMAFNKQVVRKMRTKKTTVSILSLIELSLRKAPSKNSAYKISRS